MSVHEAITEHVSKQHEMVKAFSQLDAKREVAIERVIAKAKAGEQFDTTEINTITEKINELSKGGLTPKRKLVSPEMVLDYVEKGNL